MAKSKSKKKKYLSLRRHLAPPLSPSPSPPPSAPKTETSPRCTNHHENKLDSFPLDPNVASLFFSSSNGEAPETLTDILGTASASGENPVIESSSIGSPESGLIGLSGGDSTDGLAKRALRGRQRVEYCCSSSSSEEEVASGINGVNGQVDLWSQGVSKKSPLLKLDYEEIITAWSDRGSLYIDEGIQIVPEVHRLAFPVLVDVGMTWIVPTVPKEELGDDTKKKGEMETREMRVRRYKEKRRNRLFNKKIRYEVRKLNAEKRPRIKGRFVKATEDG